MTPTHRPVHRGHNTWECPCGYQADSSDERAEVLAHCGYITAGIDRLIEYVHNKETTTP